MVMILANFGSLWVGRPLNKIEITCLSSFIYHGHDFKLFVYDMNLKVPEGIEKIDANSIISKDKIFKVDNSYGPFADMFRYKMIQQTGLTWTDTDNICLQNKWKFSEYLFGMQGGPHKVVANGILRAPQNSDFINDLVETSTEYNKKDITWSEIGPKLVTEKIKEYNLNGYIQPPEVFYPVNYWEWEHIFHSSYLNSVLRSVSNSHTLQIWNQMLNRSGADGNQIPEGSAMQYYYKKYVGKKR